MAKKNNTTLINVWILFSAATLLLSAGWLMKSFPVLIFIGIAPLFAISDVAKDKETPWNHLELILLSFAISLFCASVFDATHLILVLTQAILLTLAFAGYTFSYQSLGSKLGKFTIIFFWLGLEYLMLKLPWRSDFYFLADALELQTSWWKWNTDLGYLGVSIWVLVVNLIFYLAFLKSSSINWFLVALAVILVAGPLIYSIFYVDVPGLNRVQMIALYSNDAEVVSENYKNRGELITRTAAWVSVLILLLAVVKNKIKKK
jgi:apolipoprotein N-acyltransferase